MFVKRLPIMIALAFLLLNAAPLSAQTNRGGIAGTVFDANGAPVPNAAVKVTNVGTNQTVTLNTSDDGAFNATLLEPVVYRIEVEAPGFKKAVLENVKVDTSTVTSTNVLLEVGAVTDAVTVVANTDAATLNAENGTVSQTITQRQITDIPIGDRSVLNLMLTLPNVTGDLISEVPSTGTGTLTPGQGLSVGGGRPGSTSFLADGVSNTSSGSGRTVASFSPDTVQEFNVQTSNYSAEYGQTTGGIVNVTTKSGTNQFHGTLTYFKKDPAISAAPFTIASVNRPVSNQTIKEYPITIGGPVYLPMFGEGGPKLYKGKDRTFFFAAFEPRRVNDSSNVFALFPTEAMRAGNFANTVTTAGGVTTADVIAGFAAKGINIPVTADSTLYQQFVVSNGQLLRCPAPGTTGFTTPAGCPALVGTGGTQTYAPFAGNVIPSAFLDPTAQRLLQYIPLPNQTPFIQPNGNLANWVGRRNVVSDDNRYQFRIDHRISQANNLYVRHSHIPISGYRFNNLTPEEVDSNGPDQVNALIGDKQTSDQWVLSDTHIFSPTLVSELRLGYSRGNFSRVNPPKWQTEGFAQQFGLPSITEANLPFFTGFPFRGIGQENIASAPNQLGNEIDESFQISDTFTKTKGNQTWKFGTDLRHQRLKTELVANAAGGTYTFSTVQTSSRGTAANPTGGNSFADFLLGVPNAYAYRTTVLPYYYRWAAGALFFQDDWKVKPNLTFNLGIRYALQLPRWEKYNRQGSFLPELAKDQALTDAQRRSVATAIGIPTTSAIPDTVPTVAKIVPFGFSGYGGRSKYLLPIDYNGWEPRFGFAWVPKMGFVNRIFGEDQLVIRGGYGLSHSPLTGLGSSPSPDYAAGAGTTINFNSQTAAAQQGVGQCNPAFNIRLAGNPPCPTNLTPEQVIGAIPADGLIYDNSIKYSTAFEISAGTKTPKSETWNVTAAWSFMKGNVLELTYTGNRGTNLFLSPRNTNLVPFQVTSDILGRGLDPASTVNDPLGRLSLTGTVIPVPRGSLLAPYLGFQNLPVSFTSAGNSIRHAGSAYLKGRLGRGLTYTAAYTWSKSIDTGSDAGSNAVANTFSSRSDGTVRFGAPLNNDRSVSSFDQPHVFSGTFLWDLPIGSRGGWLLEHPPAIVDQLISGFTLSGTVRVQSGYPFAAFVNSSNYLDNNGGGSVPMNLNPDPSVQVKNPLWDPSCPVGPTCQPFINPAAWIRPPNGTVGNGPRTYGHIRGPRQEFFDLSLQKSFYVFGKDSKKRFQVRLDALNALNHPNFAFASIGGGTGFTAGRGPNNPSQAPISTAEYDAWVAADPSRSGLARSTTAGAATFNQVRNLVCNNLTNTAACTGFLPANYFSVPVPTGFTQLPLNGFDIRTLEGFKQYRLSQNWDKNFGTLSTNLFQPRKIQYSIKFIF
jgi:hypothetical protein